MLTPTLQSWENWIVVFMFTPTGQPVPSGGVIMRFTRGVQNSCNPIRFTLDRLLVIVFTCVRKTQKCSKACTKVLRHHSKCFCSFTHSHIAHDPTSEMHVTYFHSPNYQQNEFINDAWLITAACIYSRCSRSSSLGYIVLLSRGATFLSQRVAYATTFVQSKWTI